MRVKGFIGFVLVQCFLLLLLPACSTLVPATVTEGPHGGLRGEPTVFLTAARQRTRIAESLRDAGLVPARSPSDATYGLVVNVGRSRSTKPCGTMNNVVYILGAVGARLMVIKGRGLTGSCDPNIFDDMSKMLATFFPEAG